MHCDLQGRLGDVMRGHDAPAELPLAYTCLEGFNFGDEADAQRLSRIIEEVGAQLVIIDALVDVMLGRDENLVKDVQPVLYNLRKVAQDRQCAIVLIHHANRGGSYRCSSALKGAVKFVGKNDVINGLMENAASHPAPDQRRTG